MSFHVIGLAAIAGVAHGLEIVLGDPLETAHRRNLRFLRQGSLRHGRRRCYAIRPSQWMTTSRRRRHRQLFESPQNLLLRPHRVLGIRDLGLRNADLETEDVVGLHGTPVHVAERSKASDLPPISARLVI